MRIHRFTLLSPMPEIEAYLPSSACRMTVVFGRNVRKTPAKTLWVPIPIF